MTKSLHPLLHPHWRVQAHPVSWLSLALHWNYQGTLHHQKWMDDPFDPQDEHGPCSRTGPSRHCGGVLTCQRRG